MCFWWFDDTECWSSPKATGEIPGLRGDKDKIHGQHISWNGRRLFYPGRWSSLAHGSTLGLLGICSVLPGIVDDVSREGLQIVVDDELPEGIGGLLPWKGCLQPWVHQRRQRCRTYIKQVTLLRKEWLGFNHMHGYLYIYIYLFIYLFIFIFIFIFIYIYMCVCVFVCM